MALSTKKKSGSRPSDFNKKIDLLQTVIADDSISESYLIELLLESNCVMAIAIEKHFSVIKKKNNSNSSEALSINHNMNNISLSAKTRKRKRKRNKHKCEESLHEPSAKRQKTEANQNCNTNSSMKEENEITILSPNNAQTTSDTNWTQKVLGTLHLEYSVHRRSQCSLLSIWHIAQCARRGDITIDTVYKQNKFMKSNKLVVYYQRALNEFKSQTQLNTMNIKISMKEKRLISGKSQEEIAAEYDAIREEEKRIRRERRAEYEKLHDEIREKYLRVFKDLLKSNESFNIQHYVNSDLERIWKEKSRKHKAHKPKTVIIDSKYAIAFEIALIRAAPNIAQKSFPKLNIPYALGIFAQTKELSSEINKTLCIRNEYQRKKLPYTLVGLLDFACRYSYNITEANNNEAFDHKLNVSLHDYQLQSLDWMLSEERDPIGFHRHLFAKGAFCDAARTPFYYSTVFEHLIVANECGSLPIARGGFLCEEMGLGKTIISLALINCNKAKKNKKNKNKSRATLIIAPVSLVGQWETECDDKSCGKLRYKRYYSDRSRNVKEYLDVDIVFTTYGIMQMECGTDKSKHILHCIEWHRIILDESHSIKSGNCVRSKSINRLQARHKWCLSGTPFGNQVSDIANQLLFIGMSQKHINRLQLSAISNGIDKFSSAPQSNGLMYIMSKLVMRHKKKQQFNNQPIVKMGEKQECVVSVAFTAKQRKYYDILYETAAQRYNRYAATGNIGRGYIDILSSLHGARQACSGYIYSKEEMERNLSMAQKETFRIKSMVNKYRASNKSNRELYEMAKDEAFNVGTDGECPICYECPLDNPLQTPCRHLFCAECIQGVLYEKEECPICRTHVERKELKKPLKKATMQEEEKEKDIKEEDDDDDDDDDLIRFDAKIKVLMKELKKIKKNGANEKSLIFTSFSKSLHWICSELKRNKFEFRTLCGNMSLSRRKREFEEFSNNPNVSVFVLTVRTGAVGITLTAANHVFMLEPTFNAALHRQAINRVYRLGQKKKVFIYTMIMKDSVEEKIWNINKHKKEDLHVGSINNDKNSKLKQHEISKLFQ